MTAHELAMTMIREFRHKMKKIAASKPYDAIDLMFRFWYYAYAKENELDIGKVDILYALAVREETIKGFLERLEQLPKLIESYKCTDLREKQSVRFQLLIRSL